MECDFSGRVGLVTGGAAGIGRAIAVGLARLGTHVMVSDAGVTVGSEMQAFLAKEHAVGRLGTPEEIADAATWLLSDGASFTTGATLFVNGGLAAL